LVNIWGPPDAETQAKIKYAKWNAVRIAKALKEGKDPNESNPKPQQEESMPPMGLNDLDEQQASVSDKFHHATVEELPDEQDQFNTDTAPHASTNYSLHTPVQASSAPVPPNQEVSPRDEFPHTEDHDDSVSPIEPSQSNDRSDSVGGGFFPLPTFTAEPNESTLPTAPPSDVNDLGLASQPSFVPGSRIAPPFEPPPPPSEPQDYYRANPPHVQPSSTNLPHTPMPRPTSQSPQNLQHHTPLQYQPPPAPYQAAVQQPPVQSGASGTNLMEVDDEAISQAQKHARWAISALNFEDTQTAIKELREALRRLGAGT
jgi:vacuolar protein sorting-associated protein VTA1